MAGTLAATGCFWLVRASLDKGQASLLYLPVVIACAIRFGFGAAVMGALLSFLCWDFFFFAAVLYVRRGRFARLAVIDLSFSSRP